MRSREWSPREWDYSLYKWSLWPRSRPSPNHADTLASDFQPPELGSIPFCVSKATCLWHFITAAGQLRPSLWASVFCMYKGCTRSPGKLGRGVKGSWFIYWQGCFGWFDVGLQHKKHGQGSFRQRKSQDAKRSAQPREQKLPGGVQRRQEAHGGHGSQEDADGSWDTGRPLSEVFTVPSWSLPDLNLPWPATVFCVISRKYLPLSRNSVMMVGSWHPWADSGATVLVCPGPPGMRIQGPPGEGGRGPPGSWSWDKAAALFWIHNGRMPSTGPASSEAGQGGGSRAEGMPWGPGWAGEACRAGAHSREALGEELGGPWSEPVCSHGSRTE